MLGGALKIFSQCSELALDSPVGDFRSTYKIIVEKPEGKNYLEELDLNRSIVLKLVIDRMLTELNYVRLNISEKSVTFLCVQ